MNENLILLVVVSMASLYDYMFRKVPNLLIFPAIFGGIATGLFSNGYVGLLASISGLLIGITLLSIPYAKGGMGGGDVKLLGAIGAIKGPQFVFAAFLAASIIGGIMAVFRMAFIIKGCDARILRQSFKAAYYTGALSAIEVPEYALKERLPYALAISAGAVAALIL